MIGTGTDPENLRRFEVAIREGRLASWTGAVGICVPQPSSGMMSDHDFAMSLNGRRAGGGRVGPFFGARWPSGKAGVTGPLRQPAIWKQLRQLAVSTNAPWRCQRDAAWANAARRDVIEWTT